MEFCFDDLMKMVAAELAHKFKFHPLCQQIGLTNIFFANDLCILCSADNDSICIIRNVITKSGEATGLKPNLSKSSCFFAGIPELLENSLSAVMDIPKASYLLSI
ncbi:hypothetical protein LIER_23698 [Lithospermum erythrorhizon]|uniref:Reverse transcriptase domain-containing protein n=1 Tax=Lithospermum erythrorhizon TaxID=34254 RepID=A0AAV3R1L3_LITER